MALKDIAKFGKGAVMAPPDARNYLWEQVMGVGELSPFDWGTGYGVEKAIGQQLKVEHQDGSSSCVAQAVSKYGEVLGIDENNGILPDLSAKDIYSRIFLPSGGAYIAEGMRVLVKRGVVKESTNPSYENGNPPSEAFMRQIVEGNDSEAMLFSTKSYVTTRKTSIEQIAQMIRDNKGVVTGFTGTNRGWSQPDVRPPQPNEPVSAYWGHAVFLGRAEMRNGRQMIGFLNSWGRGWGEDGWGWFDESYLPYMFDLNTFVDKVNIINNINKNMRHVILPNGEQMLLDDNLKLAGSIGDEIDLAAISANGNKLTEPPQAIKPEDLAGYLLFSLVDKSRAAKKIKEITDLLNI